MLNILVNPNPILRKKSKGINASDIPKKSFKALCSDMLKTMLKNDGVGLSAPQIGKNIRLVVINVKDKPLVLINPVITKKSWAKEFGQEGCLSFPGIFGKVKRHKKVNCCYLDLTGKKVKITTQGFLSRVIQHEIDHLDGILFIDKATDLEKHND